MTEKRKIAAILAADVVGFSRMASADEDRTLARLRALRADVIDPIIASQNGRVFKRTGDGALVEFRSVVEAVRCAISVQNAMMERNIGTPEDQRIVFRVGIHLGDVVEESDGDLMGDGVNIAARLEGIAKPGAICLSEDAFRQVKGRLDLAITDLGPTALKNIAEPVHAYSVEVGVPAAAKHAERPALALPDKPSIAVLPFQNMSGDPEQEYFVDGLVEDIITGLSRIKWLFVIARNSSFVYKGKAVDIRQVGRELGVRYVLEGGVRKAGGRLRITAQLIEAESGAHIWADRFDGALEDVFDLQDQITDRVVGVVAPSLRESEIERATRKRPENLDAYDLYLRGLPHARVVRPEELKSAIALFEDALRLAPNYAAVHAQLAICHAQYFLHCGGDEADRSVARLHLRAAIATGADDFLALTIAAFAMIMVDHDQAGAQDVIERALALNPSSAGAHFAAGWIRACHGDVVGARAHSDRGLRLSPFDRAACIAHESYGLCALHEDRPDEAALHFGKEVLTNPGLIIGHFYQAAALALAGRIVEARSIAQRGMTQQPTFSMRSFSFFVPEIADKLIAGARLLGLPE